MSQRYAKLYAKAGENPDVGELLETDPLAVALFFLSLSRADVYGILPAEPRRYRARVAPSAVLPTATVAQALDAQERCGWIKRYTSSLGEELLHIVHYNDLQDVRWANRIGPPEYELPPWWQAPQEFVAYLASIDLDRVRDHEKRQKWVVLRGCYCSTPVALQENNPTQDTRHKTQNDLNDLLPEPAHDAGSGPAEADQSDASDQPAEPPAPKPTKTKQATKRTVRPAEEVEAAIATQRARLPTGCEDLLDAFLDMFAESNKTGRMARTRELTITTELADKTERDRITTDALRHGLTAAIGKGAANVNYVVKAANGYDPEQNAQRPPAAGGNGRRFITCSDGTRVYENSEGWGYTQDLSVAEAQRTGIWNPRTGCTTEPSRGFCCDDGWFYASRDDGSMYQDRRWRQ